MSLTLKHGESKKEYLHKIHETPKYNFILFNIIYSNFRKI